MPIHWLWDKSAIIGFRTELNWELPLCTRWSVEHIRTTRLQSPCSKNTPTQLGTSVSPTAHRRGTKTIGTNQFLYSTTHPANTAFHHHTSMGRIQIQSQHSSTTHIQQPAFTSPLLVRPPLDTQLRCAASTQTIHNTTEINHTNKVYISAASTDCSNGASLSTRTDTIWRIWTRHELEMGLPQSHSNTYTQDLSRDIITDNTTARWCVADFYTSIQPSHIIHDCPHWRHRRRRQWWSGTTRTQLTTPPTSKTVHHHHQNQSSVYNHSSLLWQTLRTTTPLQSQDQTTHTTSHMFRTCSYAILTPQHLVTSILPPLTTPCGSYPATSLHQIQNRSSQHPVQQAMTPWGFFTRMDLRDATNRHTHITNNLSQSHSQTKHIQSRVSHYPMVDAPTHHTRKTTSHTWLLSQTYNVTGPSNQDPTLTQSPGTGSPQQQTSIEPHGAPTHQHAQRSEAWHRPFWI